MEFFGLSWEILFVYALIVGVFIAFIHEKLPPDITAMGAFILLIVVGILDRDEALRVFSNSAPITIGAMFIISAALDRTGCLQILGSFIGRIAGKSSIQLLLVVMPLVLIISAFMNNTPVVVILTPVLISIARKMDVAPSKVLIPLSYAAILGGTITIIGTSTNILVNGIAMDYGLDSFGMFDITLPGLIMAMVGFAYMVFVGRFLLPDRHSLSGVFGKKEGKKFITRLIVPAASPLIDKQLQNLRIFKGEDTVVLDVIRHGDSMYEDREGGLEGLDIRANDRIIVESTTSEILGMKEDSSLMIEHALGSAGEEDEERPEESIIVEGIVSNDSNLRGKYISSLRFRKKYGIYVVGVNKIENRFLSRNTSSVLEPGDAILLEGPITGMQQLFRENGLVNLTVPEERSVRRDKAPIALITLVGVVFLAALNVLPIVLSALVGAGIVVLTRCVDARDIYKTIDWSILFLIFGMLGISVAMERTGAAAVFVEAIVNQVEGKSPLLLLACFYALTSFLTEIVSNNAVAALLAPIAIGVSSALGLNPEPLLIAVMFGASASFATPIGYQTNTFVYAAGGYKFADFLKIGIPMNIIMFIVAVVVIPMFWDF